MLLRSLPESVRTFCLHHTSGETYQSFRAAALRWEQQQRAFAEFQPKKQLYQLGNESESAAEYYDMTASDGNGEWNLDAVGNSGHRCTKCGSRKHGASMCDADLTKVRCFKCQKFGHISANCPDRSGKGKGDGKGVIKGKGRTKGKSKGKAKGKGFGKKGEMNELGYAEETDGMDEWYQDDGSWWSDQTWLQAAQVWRPQENRRLETRYVGTSKRAFHARLPSIFTLCSFKIDVFLRIFLGLKICNPKIDVSREGSVNFHHVSQNATPATEFAPCRHGT